MRCGAGWGEVGCGVGGWGGVRWGGREGKEKGVWVSGASARLNSVGIQYIYFWVNPPPPPHPSVCILIQPTCSNSFIVYTVYGAKGSKNNECPCTVVLLTKLGGPQKVPQVANGHIGGFINMLD
jgi:hypothetical protein